MANNNQRMITMPDGKQYPLMPQPTPNPYAGRAAAQEAVQQQQPVADTTANPDVQAFAQGKAAANTTPNLFRTPVTEPYIRAAINKPAVIQRNNTTPQEHKQNFVQERQQEQQQNNKPITSMEELARAMGYTSQEDEDKLRKASMTNRRILAVADALRHIGNIANTVGYAPVQQFNNPVLEEQARYEKGKALRDRANQQYLAYQQAKAKQDAEQRRWEQQFGLQQANAASQHAYRQEQARIAAENAANRKAYQEGQLGLGRERVQNDAKHKQEMERQGRQRIGIASQNAKNMQNYRQWRMNGGGSGSGIVPLDTPKGQITPNGKSYGNQLLQMFDYARAKGYVKESDVAKRLRELGFGKDQSDNVKRQMVMDLLRTNQDMGDYASSRLGWSYGGGGGMDLGLEDDEDEMDLGLE